MYVRLRLTLAVDSGQQQRGGRDEERRSWHGQSPTLSSLAERCRPGGSGSKIQGCKQAELRAANDGLRQFATNNAAGLR
jgi:hypothetical protein